MFFEINILKIQYSIYYLFFFLVVQLQKRNIRKQYLFEKMNRDSFEVFFGTARVAAAAAIMKPPEQLRNVAKFNCLVRLAEGRGYISHWPIPSANITYKYAPLPVPNLIFGNARKSGFLEATHSVPYLFCNLAAAGAVIISSLLFEYPLNSIRTRMAADVGRTGTVTKLMQLVRSVGFLSLYRGVAPIFVKRTLCLGTFGIALSQVTNPKGSSFLINWTVTQVAWSVAILIMYPFATVRRRLLMQAEQMPAPVKYKNYIHGWQTIAKEEGRKGFFKGASPCVLRCVGAAFWVVCGSVV